ncbi:hypothetical protein [Lagierella massiliensis]|uniref:hypothetical protein n=1 Tax=Lagierella massiliensis TaxID=1689303 RepID=UPI0006D7D026|nr:hypothetical protein [Lagierella massiliensis]
MRYDDKVVFISEVEGSYDSKTGNYTDGGEVVSKEYFAKITDASREYLNLMYGGLRKGVYVVRIKNLVKFKDDFLKVIGGRFKSDNKYKIIDHRILRGETIFYVEELTGES